MPNFDPERSDEPLFHTQGGGIVRETRNGDSHEYHFVDEPDPCLNLKVGDLMPEEWGIHPANKAARRLMEQEDPATKCAMTMAEVMTVIARAGEC